MSCAGPTAPLVVSLRAYGAPRSRSSTREPGVVGFEALGSTHHVGRPLGGKNMGQQYQPEGTGIHLGLSILLGLFVSGVTSTFLPGLSILLGIGAGVWMYKSSLEDDKKSYARQTGKCPECGKMPGFPGVPKCSCGWKLRESCDS